MKKVALLMLKSAMLLGLACCGQVVHNQLMKSRKQRNTSPVVDETKLAIPVAGNSEFAFNLYRTVGQKGNNLFFSPYSISEALAMAFAGARGDTEKDGSEIVKKLRKKDRACRSKRDASPDKA